MDKITNTKMPLFWYTNGFYTELLSSNPLLVKIKTNVKKGIEQFLDKPANKENCQTLKMFINHQIAEIKSIKLEDKDKESSDEVINKLNELVELLQSGIDLDDGQKHIYGDNMFGKHTWSRPASEYDPNTLEGYLMIHEREFSVPTYNKSDFIRSGYYKHCIMKGWDAKTTADTFTILYGKAE